jgi:hypothetical protein
MISTTLALKLHAYGISRLHDSVWCGETLWERVKRHYRGREEPRWMFQRTIKNGLLFHLGLWIFEEYVEDDSLIHNADAEWALDYIADLMELLMRAGVSPSDHPLALANRLFARPELEEPWDMSGVQRSNIKQLVKRRYNAFHERYSDVFREAKSEYASNYAERVFHDRELCGYVAQLLVEIGIDGTVGDEAPSKWCKRTRIPMWAIRAIYARDRGCCAACSQNVSLELLAEVHIDHIVPLARGGCNDLVNLQLLCSECNYEKQARLEPTTSSVPPYLQRRLGTIRR